MEIYLINGATISFSRRPCYIGYLIIPVTDCEHYKDLPCDATGHVVLHSKAPFVRYCIGPVAMV